MNIDFFADLGGNSGVSIYSKELYEELEDEEYRVNNLEPFSILRPHFINQVLLNPIRLLGSDADLLHFASQDLMSAIHLPETSTVVTVHDIFPYLDYSGLVYSWMSKIYVDNIEKSADRVIAISEATKEQLIKNTSLESEKIDVVYQGVDLEKFRPVDEDLGYDNYFLHVGHELDRKNIEGLIAAFEKIKAEDAETKLIRVGNIDRTEKLLKNSDLVLGEDVIQEEDVDLDRLVNLYSNARKLLFPSEGEGFGRPMIESLACGTPVVAYNRKPMREVLPETMLVEWKDTESFAHKALNDESYDCRKVAQKFTWERTAEQTKEVYKKCLKSQ